MGIRFEFFEAGCGDSILVSTDEGTHVLIDGGESSTYQKIKSKLREIEKLDLVVLTHVDNDHICGLISLLRKDNTNRKKINQLWFNSFKSIHVGDESNGNIGASQGILFEQLIQRYEHIEHKGDLYLRDTKKLNEYQINQDIQLVLLSPRKSDLDKFKIDWQNNKEKMKSKFCNGKVATNISSRRQDTDSSLNNRTSIAFILKYRDEKYLFLGDAHIDVINESLKELGYSSSNKLKLKFVKLSHHGSIKNIDNDFLDLIDCQKFVILTNGKKFNHPSESTLELIYKQRREEESVEFIFNYRNCYREKFSQEDKEKYNFKANFRRNL